MKKILTSESVNCGHPDKTCDIIADSFLDDALRQDKNAQMAVECAIKDDLLMIYGESKTTANIDYENIARTVLKDIGYKNDFRVIKTISQQSSQINSAINKKEICANDQGMMYGFATNEIRIAQQHAGVKITDETYMPLTVVIAHELMKQYEVFRRKNSESYFADAKSQVSVLYYKDVPTEIKTVVMSVSHADSVKHSQIVSDIKEIIKNVLAKYVFIKQNKIKYIINPSGKFSIWGSFSDSGCVGRKIIVDTYGGIGRVGGGCFSSKNATKVDRSSAYFARYAAKNIVAKGYADKCEIQVSYGIGLPKPISLYVDCFKTNKVPLKVIDNYIKENFDFSLSNIIAELDLLKPVYKQTACYGHFGNSAYAWEKFKK